MKNIKILLIEDEHNASKMVRYILDSDNNCCKVLTDEANSLKDGLKKIIKNDYDVILLDLSLPNGEGLKVFSKVKTVSRDIPVVIISCHEDKAIEAIQRGAEDYLIKPVKKNDLLRSIRISIERSKIKKELRKSKLRYKALYNNAPDMYFNIDIYGTIIDVNRFSLKNLGYCRREIMNQNIFKVVYKEDKHKVRKHLNSIISAEIGEEKEIEFRKITKGGKILWVYERAKKIEENNIFIICRDITDKKEYEEKISKLIESREKDWEKDKLEYIRLFS